MCWGRSRYLGKMEAEKPTKGCVCGPGDVLALQLLPGCLNWQVSFKLKAPCLFSEESATEDASVVLWFGI